MEIKHLGNNRGIPIRVFYMDLTVNILVLMGTYKTNNSIFNCQFNFLKKGNINFNSPWLNGRNFTNTEYFDYFFSSISIIKKYKWFNYEIGWSNIPW